MTVTDRSVAAPRVPMDSLRKTALAAGMCDLTTFTSIPTLVVYHSVKEQGYIDIPPTPRLSRLVRSSRD